METSRAWIRSLKDGRCELNARIPGASLRLFSSRATCLESFNYFVNLHGVTLTLEDLSAPVVIPGQTSIMDLVS